MRRSVFIAFVLFLMVFQSGWSQRPGEAGFKDSPALPDGVKGKRIRSLIETVNSSDPDRIRRFITEECTEQFRTIAPMEGHISVFLGLFRETGGIEFHSIRTCSPEREAETVVIVKDKNLGNWMGLTLRFTEAPKFLVGGAGFSDARTPTDVVEPPLSEDEILEQTKTIAGRLIDKGVFSGAVLIAKGEKVLLTMAGGEASKAFHVPNNVDTKFNLGSMNKIFTSTAVVQLAEKGNSLWTIRSASLSTSPGCRRASRTRSRSATF